MQHSRAKRVQKFFIAHNSKANSVVKYQNIYIKKITVLTIFLILEVYRKQNKNVSTSRLEHRPTKPRLLGQIPKIRWSPIQQTPR